MDEHEENRQRIRELLQGGPAKPCHQVAAELGLSAFEARIDLEIMVDEGEAEKFAGRGGVSMYTVPDPGNRAA